MNQINNQLPMLAGRTLLENRADVTLYHICLNQVSAYLRFEMQCLWRGAKHVETLRKLNE